MGLIDAKLPSEVFVHRGRPVSPPPTPLREPSAPRSSRGTTGLLQPGAILDKYRIEEVIGTGGFGAVYRATHLVLRMTVAIKHLRREIVAERPGIVAHLVEEARWAARIQHPSVVRVFDVTENPSLTYVVMEFIDGAPLSRVIDARGQLGAAEVAALGIDVAEGLEAGLVQGLIHRDIKPANILVAKSGRARIVDLGLACAAVASARDGRPSSVVGTRGYIAPEQLKDPARADFRADIFSLGITLDEALRGRRRDREPSDTAAKLLLVLHRMTAPDRAERIQTYRGVVEALRAARAGR